MREEQVASNVQRWRTDSGTTQEQLAGAVGVSRQTIIAMEKGNYAPSVLLALRLARYFKTSVENLFTLRYDS